MLVAEYNRFVSQTDQFKERSVEDRHEIAVYGIAGEIGSLLSAIKKKLLAEDGESTWNKPNDEIIWEIGDVIWYCFSLAQILNRGGQFNILTSNIAQLRREIGGKTERARIIHQALDLVDTSKKERFLNESRQFPKTSEMTFDDYQKLAYLTARTEGRILLEVCLALLWQLGAELLRITLPEVERRINNNVSDRDPNSILGEIAWHLAAISSIYGLSMNMVVSVNVEKITFRASRSDRTSFHDDMAVPEEQFPRKFEVAFISVGPGRSRMYFDGKRLGDPLTDNAYEDDGYRFHDVMHLANIAHLGWSPVIRKLMGRKRKLSGRRLDEVEDGARALLVEEVVLKAIHSEGKRLAREIGIPKEIEPRRHFPSRSMITFRLLKSLQDHVEGLEVQKNKFWEWEDAIFEGAAIFHELRKETQGTVTVDMVNRRIGFNPDVYLDIAGTVAGVSTQSMTYKPDTLATRIEVAKKSILAVLGFSTSSEQHVRQLDLKLREGPKVAIKASGEVESSMWERDIVTFKLSFLELPDVVCCTAVAIADV